MNKKEIDNKMKVAKEWNYVRFFSSSLIETIQLFFITEHIFQGQQKRKIAREREIFCSVYFGRWIAYSKIVILGMKQRKK